MNLPRPGEILEGKYRLEEALGEGAFGLVVRGTTLSTNRPVAIKLLKPAPGGYKDSRAQRFMRELRAIASLQCPHTLTLYDYGKSEAGVLYMVTEYIEGEDLFELLRRRGKLSEDEVKHVLKQVLLSLAEAHERGMLHRDIKPHNIRVYAYEGDPLCVKVLDFGLSKTLEEEGGGAAAGLTAAGIAVGTPRYMSPEQLRGSKELTPGSDIYSLGLVAYEMLFGQPAVPIDEMVGARRPIRIGDEHDVSPFMRDLLNRMLGHRVAERFSSAADVLTSLRTGIVPMGVDSPDISGDYRRGLPPATRTGEHAALTLPPPPSPTLSRTALVAAGVAVIAAVGFAIYHATADDDLPPPVVSRAPIQHAIAATAEPDRPTPAEEDTGVRESPVMPDDASDRCSGMTRFKPGLHTIEQLEGITKREAIVVVPPGYEPPKRFPVIWTFRDYDQSNEELLATFDFDSLRGIEPFIVMVAQVPQANLLKAKVDWDALWDDFYLANERLCLDEERIYLLGHGLGARLTHTQLCSTRFAGIATTSALMRRWQLERMCEPRQPIPFLMVTSSRDPAEPLEGGVNCGRDVVASREVQHRHFLETNGCSGAERPWKPLPDSCQTWKCDAPFVSCVAPGGGGWTRGNREFELLPVCNSGDSKFPHTRAVWEFFSQVGKRDRRANAE